jgi:hypothetical protein
MKNLTLVILLFLISACTALPVKDEFSHMRKSQAIETILEEIDELNYDESFSEIDRDRQKRSYALAFHQEVSSLVYILKKHPTTLPTKQPVAKDKQQIYQRIISLLDANLAYLKKVIDRKQDTLIISAVKSTKKSCVECHLHFRSSL